MREGICRLQRTVILHLNTPCHRTNYIREGGKEERERERGEGGGRHCTESTSTTMDGRTPKHTHTHTHYCTGSWSAFHCTLLAARTSLCLVKAKWKIFEKQRTNRLNKQQMKKKNTLLVPTGSNKKIKPKRNLDYKKSQWHQVLQKAFSQWLAFEQLYAFSFSLPSIYY